MDLKCTVVTPNRKVEFRCIARHAKKLEALLIEPEFYTRFGKGIPSGDHFELELIDTSWRPPENNQIHIHSSKLNGRDFVCYPLPIPTLESATEVFRLWCVGTAYTLDHGKSFNSLFKGDVAAFLKHMEEEYGIRVEE